MQEVVIFGKSYQFELQQEDGSALVVTMPASAKLDAAFLHSWLHGKAEKTQAAYASDIARFYDYIGKPLKLVVLADIQEFIDGLLEIKPMRRKKIVDEHDQLKPSTRKRSIAALKSLLSFGVKVGYLTFNAGAVIKLPKLEDTLAERILSEQQVARMFALETNQRNHAILTLLYRAGLRASELCNLTWAKLQPREESGQIAIFGKGRKTRFILLDKETWEEITALKPPDVSSDAYVFLSRQARSRLGTKGKRLDESSVHRVVRDAARRAAITSDVSPHFMRHAHASHAQDNGAPIALVAETLGHKNIATTIRYSHIRPAESSTKFLGV